MRRTYFFIQILNFEEHNLIGDNRLLKKKEIKYFKNI